MASPAALLGALPPLPDGATLYLLMNMREVEPSVEALSDGLGEQWGEGVPHACKQVFDAIREAGGRVFLPVS